MISTGRARSARWWLVLVFVGAAGASMAADISPDSTYWRRQQEGWFWYRDPPPARLPKPDPPRASVPAAQPPEVLAHAALKARLEQGLAVATMNPSPANVRAYLALQTAAVRQASTFADAWQQVVWAMLEFDFTLELTGQRDSTRSLRPGEAGGAYAPRSNWRAPTSSSTCFAAIARTASSSPRCSSASSRSSGCRYSRSRSTAARCRSFRGRASTMVSPPHST